MQDRARTGKTHFTYVVLRWNSVAGRPQEDLHTITVRASVRRGRDAIKINKKDDARKKYPAGTFGRDSQFLPIKDSQTKRYPKKKRTPNPAGPPTKPTLHAPPFGRAIFNIDDGRVERRSPRQARVPRQIDSRQDPEKPTPSKTKDTR